MKTMLIGVSGLLGSNLAERLLNEGHEVIGICRNNDGKNLEKIENNKNFHLNSGDIQDMGFVREIIRSPKPEIIFHLAALIPDNKENGAELMSVNALGTANILQSMSEAGVKNIIYASSVSVYGLPKNRPIDEKTRRKPVNFYGLSKSFSEDLLGMYSKKHGIHAIAFRFAGIYGNPRKSGAIYRFVNGALNNEVISFNSKSEGWAVIYVDDAVNACVKAMRIVPKSKFRVFNIGGGDANLKDLAEKIISITGSSSKIILKDDEKTAYHGINDLSMSEAKIYLGYECSPLEDCLKKYISELRPSGVVED